MSEEEYQALKLTCKVYRRMLKEVDMQGHDFPHLKATSVDLYAKFGEESLDR